jgi:hypothetical protein
MLDLHESKRRAPDRMLFIQEQIDKYEDFWAKQAEVQPITDQIESLAMLKKLLLCLPQDRIATIHWPEAPIIELHLTLDKQDSGIYLRLFVLRIHNARYRISSLSDYTETTDVKVAAFTLNQ